MYSKSGGELDKWRDYFKGASSDIFTIIEHAIMVAATDSPQEFRVRREKIAELLFTCRLTRCSGCDRVELAVSEGDNCEVKVVTTEDNHGVNVDDHMGRGTGSEGSKLNCTTKDNADDDNGGSGNGNGEGDGNGNGMGRGAGSEGSKLNSTTIDNADDDNDDNGGNGNGEGDGEGDGNEMIDMLNHEINFSYGAAEALTNEIEEAKVVVNEVFKIKNIIMNSKDESESVLFESLRRLQLMVSNYDIIKTTEIGKVVNRIRKHPSKKIQDLVRVLIHGWKAIVDEWMKTTQEITGGTPDSINPSTIDEEEGLPSPPLDEGAFLSSENMDFTKFFDGMDEDGNPRNSGEFSKNLQVQETGRKSSAVKQDPPKKKTHEPTRRQEPLCKPSKPSSLQFGSSRVLKPNADINKVKDSKNQQTLQKSSDQIKPPPQPEKVSNDNTVQQKLETTKRKLQESYQQAEIAKKRRTIQVMELQDIPKQRLVKPKPLGKVGNNSRHRTNGRT